MKKWKWRLLAVVLTLSLLAPPLSVRAGSLTVTSVTGARGDETAVELRLDSQEVCSGSLNVLFDSTKLEFVSAERSAESGQGAVNLTAPGKLRVNFASTEPLTQPVLCRLTFRITADTPTAGTPITLDGVRLYDQNAKVVSTSLEMGSVTRSCAWLEMSSSETVEGQAARVELQLSGSPLPAGGSLTVVYDPAVLKPTAVIPLDQTSGVRLTQNLSESGKVYLSFASTAAIPAGKLCALVFQAVGQSDSSTQLSLEDACLFDENGAAIDSGVVSGTIGVVLPEQNDPKLWVLGGAIQADGTAKLGVRVDGRGLVCGGQFTLDLSGMTVQKVEADSSVVWNCGDSGKTLEFSWASAAPMMDETMLATVTLSGAVGGTYLTPKNVYLFDAGGNSIGRFDARRGLVSAHAEITAAADTAQTVKTDAGTSVSLAVDVSDVRYYTDEQVSLVTCVLALYDSNGRMTGVGMQTARPLEDGTAELQLTADASLPADSYRVIVMESGQLIPAGAAVSGSLDAGG